MIDPEAPERDSRRAERWARVVVACLAMASAVPVAFYVGEHAESVRSELVDVGAAFTDDGATRRERLDQGATMVSAGVMAIGAAGFAAIMVLRRRRTRGVVDEALQTRRWEPTSPSLVLTTAAWGLLLASVAVAGVAQYLAARDVGELGMRMATQPAWMLLVLPGLVLGVAMSNFVHRRQHEIEPLRAAGLVQLPEPEPPDVGITGFVTGLRSFRWAVVFATLLTLGNLFGAWLGDEDVDLADVAGSWIAGALVVPAVLAGVFILTLALMTPTRWMVREVLRQPVVITTFVLIGGSMALFAADVVPAAIPIAMFVAGGVIGSVTGLYVQDLGPQPWLGILFLAFTFLFDIANDAGEVSLPTSVLGWLAAACAAGYGVVEGRKHWRSTFTAPVAVESSVPPPPPPPDPLPG